MPQPGAPDRLTRSGPRGDDLADATTPEAFENAIDDVGVAHSWAFAGQRDDTSRNVLTPVSVIIPVYNGAAFLDATLRSVRNQSYRALDIVVVDDGSTDGSPEIIEAHARQDHRITVIRQSNTGVAGARNRGLREAKGDLIAFLDHDDLWHSSIIEKLVARFEASDEETGVVYAWSCLIDQEDRIISPASGPRFEGNVLGQMCRRNFIGNGSAGMIRRAAISEVGGFDEVLSGQLAGYDDSHFYLRLAEHFKFAVVPECLVGYRLVTGSAAENSRQMIASYRHATAPFRTRYPQHAAAIDLHEKELIQWFCSRALFRRDYSGAGALLRELFHLDAWFAAYSAAFVTIRPFLMRFRRWRSGSPASFHSLDPTGAPG